MREMFMLVREAKRKELENSLNSLSLMRTAQAKNEDYKKSVSELKSRMNQIQMGSKEMLEENWNDLKKRG